VPPGENVLTAALAAGIPLPYSCRAGRCASCKSKLLSGRIEYPSGTPPGITSAEVARGEVLLCQAQPRSDLTIEARRVPVRVSNAASCEIVALEPLPLRALRLRLRFVEGRLDAHPGQFVDVRNHAGDAERLAVIGDGAGILEIECADDGSVFRAWLDASAVPGSTLRVAGPFDRPR
jgi:CDP-4-dehydro-6-deoxyglucose reductase